jgi:hypothetical protein
MIGSTRRQFLRHAAGGGLLALGHVPLISGLRPVLAEEAQLDTKMVQFHPDIEPLVRLLEETPREQLLEQVAQRIRRGLGYQQLLAALLLAGVRNVQPRPSVGFKFHAVLVVNSAHLASLSSPAEDRWLPIFWAIDYFKSSQARDVEEGNWTMAPVNEASLPAADQAEPALRAALDQWDDAAADTAVAALARTGGANELFELFARYGARDFRSIGHKAIFVANGFRTLQCIGWRHSEPVLRSLAYALLNHEGQPNPAQNDLEPDRPWRENQTLVQTIRGDWQHGRLDDGATRQLLSTLRAGGPSDACRQVVDILNSRVSPQSVYDALFAAAGEMLMRQPAIVALHAATTTNAMRYAFDTSGNDETRRLLLLQNAAFLPLFRGAMEGRGDVGDDRIDQLQPAEKLAEDQNPVEQVFDTLSRDRSAAASQLYACLDQGASPEEVIRAARQLVFLKGTDSHDYKYSSAVLEDFYHVSPAWRNRFLAASVVKLRASGDPDNGLVERIRQAIA